MVFKWNQAKRRHTRRAVLWDALLEIESSDFHEYIFAPLINISESGALLYTENMTHNDKHLAVAGHDNQLNLIIHTPANEFDSKISVKRYSWNDDICGYELGVEFRETCRKNKEFTHWLVKNIKHYHPPTPPDEGQGIRVNQH